MLNGNGHKKFTSCGDVEAEMLLEKVLAEMRETLSGTELCVVLGGSYGRGDGGVRQDKENGILYNDLDFFVFARRKSVQSEKLLKEIARKYEDELKVDVDFSRIMTVADIRNNAKRLMMQELKRGYHLVCGEDLLAEYLPERPAEKLPFSEASRLLFNRGMGLMMAGEKIKNHSSDTDFILRNIYKAILGCGDAMLISEGRYQWRLPERLNLIENSDLPVSWKTFYREAVDFKRFPHRKQKDDMVLFWNSVREFFRAEILRCAGTVDSKDLLNSLYLRSRKDGEVSWKNLMKYCLKTRSFPLVDRKKYMIPAVSGILPELYSGLEEIPEKLEQKSKLFQHWLIFN